MKNKIYPPLFIQLNRQGTRINKTKTSEILNVREYNSSMLDILFRVKNK